MTEQRARKRIRAFRLVYLFLVLNFFIPAVSYVVDPEAARKTMSAVNVLLGGTAWPVEQTQLWHMLAVGNVMTLAMMCALLLVDVRRFYPALPALVFLKSFSALYSLSLGFTEGLPGFFAVFVLDGSTSVAMVFFALRARRALDVLPTGDIDALPLWSRALLLRPRRVASRLAALQSETNLFQVSLGAARMLQRVLFRSGTVGTSADPVRASWRARLLRARALRIPFLIWERAIAPLDFTGLASSRERIIRHLLAAHHDGDQQVYDLELLRVMPGALDELHARLIRVIDGSDPRAEWLRDLCVYDGYHERLLGSVEQARAGRPVTSTDPDLTLDAFLTWCGRQPTA